MSHLSTTVHVDASPEIVFDIVADPTRGPEWHTLVNELVEVSGGSGGVGTSFVGHYRVAGQRLAGRFVVTAAERPTLLQLAGTTRGGWARWTTLIEPAEDGCDIRATMEYDLPGEILGGLFGIVTSGRLQNEFDRTYDNLRQLAERDAAAATRRGMATPVGDSVASG
jgi:uncharacterized protein YndB with AHSA1/START domain